ncbi:hypothetical protein [Natronoglycomyces albus]|uniref:Uncharacterized protein n=1 Tax=Natronoglycomyces albus TaxID=2811108 RepID=A0A895XPP2_9ACTN|nr:hypothetical protein [Natronoglycomyces albus]QSB07137.1 hypothetical protein JQS30_16800 [Natronoglycomyces albus]
MWTPSEPREVDGCLGLGGEPRRSGARRRRLERRAVAQERARRSWGQLTETGRRICQAEAQRPTGWVVPQVAQERLERLREPGSGARVLTDPREILAAFDTHEEPARWYRSRWWRTRAVVFALAQLVDWDQDVVQATGARVAEVATRIMQEWAAAGQDVQGRGSAADLAQLVVSTRSAYDAIQWLEEAGLLVCLLRGVSAAGLQADQGRAGIYAITASASTRRDEDQGQAVESDSDMNALNRVFSSITGISRPPSFRGPYREQICELDGGFRSERAQGSVFEADSEIDEVAPTARQRRKDGLWDRRVPRSDSARRAAVRNLRRLARWDVSTARLGFLLQMWWDAGWSASALMHAIDHQPNGVRYAITVTSARDQIAVIGHRLAQWVDQETGLPVTPPRPSLPAGYRAGQHQRVAQRAQERAEVRTQKQTEESEAGLSRPVRSAEAEAAVAELRRKLSASRGQQRR